MKPGSPRFFPFALAVAACLLAMSLPSRAQDAPSTQVTPTNTAPNATTESTAKVSKGDKAARKQEAKTPSQGKRAKTKKQSRHTEQAPGSKENQPAQPQ